MAEDAEQRVKSFECEDNDHNHSNDRVQPTEMLPSSSFPCFIFPSCSTWLYLRMGHGPTTLDLVSESHVTRNYLVL